MYFYVVRNPPSSLAQVLSKFLYWRNEMENRLAPERQARAERAMLAETSPSPSDVLQAMINPRNPRFIDGVEKACHTFLQTKTVFHALRGAQPLFHARCGVKTLSWALRVPAFHATGDTGPGHDQAAGEEVGQVPARPRPRRAQERGQRARVPRTRHSETVATYLRNHLKRDHVFRCNFACSVI